MITPRPKLPPRLVDMASTFAKQSGLLINNTLVDTVKCGTFTEVFARATVTVKTATLTLRIDPSEIEALRIAAGQEHRYHRKHGRNSDSEQLRAACHCDSAL